MSDGRDSFSLRNVIKGRADVYDAFNAYRGTVSKFSGAGLSGRCRGKWGIRFRHESELTGNVTYRWANSSDLTAGNTPFVAFQEHAAVTGNFILVFRTRHDAAQAALLTF